MRMRFIAQKTSGGITKRKVSLYCQILGVSRQGFYRYMKVSKLPWKYRIYAEYMMQILSEDKCNDCYGRVRMREALRQCLPVEVPILSENTVQKIMCEIGINHRVRREKRTALLKPSGTPAKLITCFSEISRQWFRPRNA